MPVQNLLSFEDLTSKDKAITSMKRGFKKLGATVVSVDVSAVKRRAGESFREVFLTFADSQTVMFAIKRTGDIFQVKLNKKEFPIRNQDNQNKAFQELVNAMDRGRSAFQKKLARIKTPLPKRTTTTTVTRLKALQEKSASISEAIQEAQTKAQDLQKQIDEVKADTAAKEAAMSASAQKEAEKTAAETIKEKIQEKTGASSQWMKDHFVII